MRSWAGVIWAFALLGLSQCFQEKTVLQYLIDNGYSKFVQLLKDTNQDQLLNGSDIYTVFAPSDAAFNRAPASVLTEVAQSHLQASALVKYHMSKALLLMPSLLHYDHIISSGGQTINFIHLGHTVILNNGTRVVSAPNNDIICLNGIVQPIDNLLIPPFYSNENIAAVLVENDKIFQNFMLSLMLTNMTSVIEGGEFTLFAPINAAYAPYEDNIFHPRFSVQRIREAFFEIIKYHLVPGARYSSMLKSGQTLYTLHGTPLNISILNSGVVVDNSAHVVIPDIPAANGVIHAVDHLLFPGDLLAQLRKEYYAAHPTTPAPVG